MAEKAAAPPSRSNSQAMRRGFFGRCPHCGEGKMFDGYLAVVRKCASCGEHLGLYRAADGPAFLTGSFVGLLLIPVLGFGFIAFRSDPLTLALVVSVCIGLLTLVLLRLIKGAFVGHLWAQHEIDPGA